MTKEEFSSSLLDKVGASFYYRGTLDIIDEYTKEIQQEIIPRVNDVINNFFTNSDLPEEEYNRLLKLLEEAICPPPKIKLEPCPFCGNPDIEVEILSTGSRIICPKCGMGLVPKSWTKEEAVRRWNERKIK